MEKKKLIKPRKSIHENTPRRELSDQENESTDQEDESQSPTKSTSDNKALEGEDHVDKDLKNEVSFFSYKLLMYILAFIVAILCILLYTLLLRSTKQEKICSFASLEEQYRAEDPLVWKRLQVGMELILNKQTQNSGVYLFAYNGGQEVFPLIKHVAAHSSRCFGKDMALVEMDRNDFLSLRAGDNDFGHAIEKYKKKIKDGNVVLIANLNEIPPDAAKALHFICDTYSPIALNVIFLTLTIQQNKNGSANAIVEETLRELWSSSLEDNYLDALITRVTDDVIILQS